MSDSQSKSGVVGSTSAIGDGKGAVRMEALYDTSVEAGDEITPEVSGLYNWVNDNRTLGFGLFGAYAKRDSSAAIGQTNDWVVRRADDFFADTSIVRAGSNPSNYVNAPASGELFAIPQDSRYDA